MSNVQILVPRYPCESPYQFTRLNVIDNGDGTCSIYVEDRPNDGYASKSSLILATGLPVTDGSSTKLVGSGTAGNIPLWGAGTPSRTLGNSILGQSGSNIIWFGGAGAGSPALKISGASLQVRLADDSAFTELAAHLKAVDAIDFADDVRQTFNPGGTTPGLNVGSNAGDPSTLIDGDVWYNSLTSALRARIGGSTVTLLSAAIRSINGDTTAAQLIVGADDISVQTAAGTTTIRRASLTGADQFFFSVGTPSTSSLSGIASVNTVRTFLLKIPDRITIAHTYMNFGSAAAGRFFGLGIWSLDMATKLLDTGPVEITANGVKDVGPAAPVAFTPGFYVLSVTTNNASLTFSTVAANDLTLNAIINFVTARVGQAANNSVAGQLPSSLGAIGVLNAAIPFAMFTG